MTVVQRMTRLGVVLAFMSLLFAGGRSHDVAEASAALAVPFTSDCVGCFDSPYWCAQDEHDAYDWSAGEWTRNGGVHSSSNPCYSGSCAGMHGPYCSPSFAAKDLDDLRVALLAGRAEPVSRLLAKHEEIQLNKERMAIQILGCSGQIVFHVPIDAAMLTKL